MTEKQLLQSYSIPQRIAIALVGMMAGGIGGALALGWGVYFASYSDRLMPFYQGGAIAGAAAAAAYAVLSSMGRQEMAVTHRRTLILSAVVSSIVLWVVVSRPPIDMSVIESGETTIVWFVAVSTLLWLSTRKRLGAA